MQYSTQPLINFYVTVYRQARKPAVRAGQLSRAVNIFSCFGGQLHHHPNDIIQPVKSNGQPGQSATLGET